MRVDFEPDRELFPFASRFYESSVGRVHYIDEGSGVPILLLHGNPTWSFLYRKIVPRLTEGFRCIAVDYPGFGLSDRPESYGYTPEEHARVIGDLVQGMQIAHSPALQKSPSAEATGRTNVFMNGLKGPGPMGFQPSVFDSQAGTPEWSPYWDHMTYAWKKDKGPGKVSFH